MRKYQRVTVQTIPLIAAIALALLLVVTGQPDALAQDGNLITNPSFEGGYSTFDPEPDIPDCSLGVCTTAQMAAGWWPWWVSHNDGDPDWKNRMPEYKPATAPFHSRVRSGSTAQQYFTFHSTHVAGLWQRVAVPANANLRFSIWGHAWSSAQDTDYSDYPTPVNMRIGIDPTGGTNPFSPNIVWSGTANVYDQYAQFTVEARAQGDHVTVFTYSAPNEARKHNDIYWDDASLVVIGAGSAPAPAPTAAGGSSGGDEQPAPPAAPAPQLGPSPTPDADGTIAVIVQSGDSLWSIAARNGLTLDELLELNNMTRNDFINAGDRIIVGYADPAEETAETEEAEETAEGEEEETAALSTEEEAAEEPTATPLPPATPTSAALDSADEGGTLCFLAFDDANENGAYDSGEALREAVALTVSNEEAVVSNYITDGVSEPYCIRGLDAGDYQVTRSSRASERMTTPGEWAITLTEGGTVDLEFGSVIDASDEVAANNRSDETTNADEVSTEESDPAAQEQEEGTGVSGLVIAVVVVAVLLLIGVLVMVLSARRSTV